MSCHLLFIYESLQLQIHCETEKFYSTKNFGYCETKKSTDSRDTTRPLMHESFRYRISLKHRRVPLRSLSILLGKDFRQKVVTSRSCAKKISEPEFFFNTQRLLYEIFWYSEEKICDKNSCYRIFYPKNFRIWKFSNIERFPNEKFLYSDSSTFRRKVVLSAPSPLSIKFLDTRRFQKNRGVTLR